MAELEQLSALDLGRAIADGEVSAVEVARHFLDRIASDDGGLGAFVTVTSELALAQAEQVDRARAAGEAASPAARARSTCSA